MAVALVRWANNQAAWLQSRQATVTVQAMAPAVYPPAMAPGAALPAGTTSLLDTHILSGSALRNRGVAAAGAAPAGGPSQSLRLVSGITYAGESRAEPVHYALPAAIQAFQASCTCSHAALCSGFSPPLCKVGGEVRC